MSACLMPHSSRFRQTRQRLVLALDQRGQWANSNRRRWIPSKEFYSKPPTKPSRTVSAYSEKLLFFVDEASQLANHYSRSLDTALGYLSGPLRLTMTIFSKKMSTLYQCIPRQALREICFPIGLAIVLTSKVPALPWTPPVLPALRRSMWHAKV